VANTFLTAGSLDFEAYRAKLVDFLKGQSRFQDYDFEGSNMAVLLDLLAYNTYHNMFYLNMIGNEMHLDTAILRESVNSRAKVLNYTPRSRTAATALVTLTVAPTDAPDAVYIPKYFPLIGSVAGKTLRFTTNEALTIRNMGGVYQVDNVAIYEGNIVNEYFDIKNGNTSFVTISSGNVDISSVSVNVRTSNTVSTNTNFTRAENLYGVEEDSTVFFLEPFGENQYNVVFGNGVTGRKLVNGNVVKVTYRDSLGVDGDGASVFTASATVGNNYPVYVGTRQRAAGGAERETIDSIKFNAPRHFASQDRAVTEEDFKVLIHREFPQLEAITVYGGEKANPKRYGKVIVSAKPIGGTVIPTSLKNQIISYLSDRDTVGMEPLIVDPKYMYVEITSNVHYSASKTDLTPSQIETSVRQAIASFSQTELSKFNADFRYSRLTAAVDNSDPGIVSNDTYCRLVMRVSPQLNTPTSYVLRTNNELYQNPVPVAIVAGNDTTVTSSPFNYVKNGVTYSAYLVDNGLGKIHVVTDTKDKGRVILADTIGTVDYTGGVVKINKISIADYTGSYIKLYFRTANKDLVINYEYILQIDDRDVNLTISKADY
jgi:hypothetical protein